MIMATFPCVYFPFSSLGCLTFERRRQRGKMSPLSHDDSARSRRASRWHEPRFSPYRDLYPSFNSPFSKIYIQYINNNEDIKLLVPRIIFTNCHTCAKYQYVYHDFSKNPIIRAAYEIIPGLSSNTFLLVWNAADSLISPSRKGS